jgi:23S rRNA pseudouridine1911/1915/1917 synthase
VIDEVVPAALDGERLDRVVALLTGASRADAASLVAAGGAALDGEVVDAGKVRVRLGQHLVIDPDRLPVTAAPVADPEVTVPVAYVDDDVIVVDKPAGLVVHPGAGAPDRTLVNGLLARFPEIATVGDPSRPGIVHRLDKGTSGLLVVARTARAYEALSAALARHEAERQYVALVRGTLTTPSGMIDAPLGRSPRDPLRRAVVTGGRPARTRFEVVERLAEFTLIRCTLETGRTHQIRVHLAAIGHPVAGDVTYGGAQPPIGLERPFLHAIRLSFDHPTDGHLVAVESPLPNDLAAVLDALR